jgi:hypothetical protein
MNLLSLWDVWTDKSETFPRFELFDTVFMSTEIRLITSLCIKISIGRGIASDVVPVDGSLCELKTKVLVEDRIKFEFTSRHDLVLKHDKRMIVRLFNIYFS